MAELKALFRPVLTPRCDRRAARWTGAEIKGQTRNTRAYDGFSISMRQRLQRSCCRLMVALAVFVGMICGAAVSQDQTEFIARHGCRAVTGVVQKTTTLEGITVPYLALGR